MPEHIFLIAVIFNLVVSSFMVGLIWLIQLVSYPLFSYVNVGDFQKYHSRHVKKISPIVALAMTLEASIALILLIFTPSDSVGLLVINTLLVCLIWVSTAFIQIPYHQRLEFPKNQILYTEKLIKTNWIRTILWTFKLIISIWVLMSFVGF
ncbi:MAG TPA: hypothetical protein DEP04_06695 [Dehalococcoidia bacterium]|nr:hypothetical protein [Chloroflexota bacterium]HCE76301.1 hypothetical protein [Dehalococcoidia bacterium]